MFRVYSLLIIDLFNLIGISPLNVIVLVVNLSSNMVILVVKNEIALALGSLDSANSLDTNPVDISCSILLKEHLFLVKESIELFPEAELVELQL